MVTLRSGKAVPYLGKNMPKRKTAKKTKKKQTEKSTATAVVQKDDTVETNESATFAAPQPAVFDNSNPLSVYDSNEVPPCNASTSHENDFSVSLNDISGTTNQSKRSVLDESSDDSAETMIDDSFEITDNDYDQLQDDSTENEALQMREPAVRICLPMRANTNNENKEPRAEDGADNNDDDKVERKPLTDLCSVTNISWF